MIRVNKWWLGVVCLVILWACPTIEAQERTIVIGGTVVTPQKILNKGWVVIRQGKISRILEKAPKEENAIWVRTDDIIFPGFIDLHNHPLYAVFRRWEPAQKFNNRYEWRSSGDYQKKVGKPGSELQADEQSFCDLTQFAEVQALTGGTTSFSGMFPRRAPAAPLPACLSKLAVRKLDMHSGFYLTEPGQERVLNVLGVTPRDLSDVVADEVVRKLAGNELDLVLIHVAEGKRAAERIAEDEPVVEGNITDLESTLEFNLLRFRSLLGPKTAVIHGAAFGKSDFRNMRLAGTALVWSPRSNMELYESTTDVITAFKEGVTIALAPDWAPTGSRNMLAEIQYAADPTKTSLGGFFSNQQFFEMATSIPARIARIDDKVGTIQAGLFADLFLLRGDVTRPFDSLVQSKPQDIALVLVKGIPVYGDAKLMSEFNVKTEPIPVCGEMKSLNLDVLPNGKLTDAVQRISQKMQTYNLTPAPVDPCAKY